MKENFEQISKLLATKLSEIVASKSFEFWQDPQFRKLVDFDSIPQVEQDRIFNELEVTGLGLLDLHLSHLSKNTKSKEAKIIFDNLLKNLPQGFLDLLASLGIEDKNVKTWHLLISMRFDEYRDNYKIALKQAKNWPEMQDKVWFQPVWARIETCSIDGWTHIRRGQTDEKDPLWKLLRHWLTELDATLIKLFDTLEKESAEDSDPKTARS